MTQHDLQYIHYIFGLVTKHFISSLVVKIIRHWCTNIDRIALFYVTLLSSVGQSFYSGLTPICNRRHLYKNMPKLLWLTENALGFDIISFNMISFLIFPYSKVPGKILRGHYAQLFDEHDAYPQLSTKPHDKLPQRIVANAGTWKNSSNKNRVLPMRCAHNGGEYSPRIHMDFPFISISSALL